MKIRIFPPMDDVDPDKYLTKEINRHLESGMMPSPDQGTFPGRKSPRGGQESGGAGWKTPRDSGWVKQEIKRFYARLCWEISKTQKGSCTLTASSTTTVVADINVRADSSIILFPVTANAMADFIAGMRIGTRTKGTSFTITHQSNANADKTFMYIIQN